MLALLVRRLAGRLARPGAAQLVTGAVVVAAALLARAVHAERVGPLRVARVARPTRADPTEARVAPGPARDPALLALTGGAALGRLAREGVAHAAAELVATAARVVRRVARLALEVDALVAVRVPVAVGVGGALHARPAVVVAHRRLAGARGVAPALAAAPGAAVGGERVAPEIARLALTRRVVGRLAARLTVRDAAQLLGPAAIVVRRVAHLALEVHALQSAAAVVVGAALHAAARLIEAERRGTIAGRVAPAATAPVGAHVRVVLVARRAAPFADAVVQLARRHAAQPAAQLAQAARVVVPGIAALAAVVHAARLLVDVGQRLAVPGAHHRAVGVVAALHAMPVALRRTAQAVEAARVVVTEEATRAGVRPAPTDAGAFEAVVLPLAEVGDVEVARRLAGLLRQAAALLGVGPDAHLVAAHLVARAELVVAAAHAAERPVAQRTDGRRSARVGAVAAGAFAVLAHVGEPLRTRLTTRLALLVGPGPGGLAGPAAAQLVVRAVAIALADAGAAAAHQVLVRPALLVTRGAFPAATHRRVRPGQHHAAVRPADAGDAAPPAVRVGRGVAARPGAALLTGAARAVAHAAVVGVGLAVEVLVREAIAVVVSPVAGLDRRQDVAHALAEVAVDAHPPAQPTDADPRQRRVELALVLAEAVGLELVDHVVAVVVEAVADLLGRPYLALAHAELVAVARARPDAALAKRDQLAVVAFEHAVLEGVAGLGQLVGRPVAVVVVAVAGLLRGEHLVAAGAELRAALDRHHALAQPVDARADVALPLVAIEALLGERPADLALVDLPVAVVVGAVARLVAAHHRAAAVVERAVAAVQAALHADALLHLGAADLHPLVGHAVGARRRVVHRQVAIVVDAVAHLDRVRLVFGPAHDHAPYADVELLPADATLRLGGVAVRVAQRVAFVDQAVAVVVPAVADLQRVRVDRPVAVVAIRGRQEAVAVARILAGGVLAVAVLVDAVAAILRGAGVRVRVGVVAIVAAETVAVGVVTRAVEVGPVAVLVDAVSAALLAAGVRAGVERGAVVRVGHAVAVGVDLRVGAGVGPAAVLVDPVAGDVATARVDQRVGVVAVAPRGVRVVDHVAVAVCVGALAVGAVAVLVDTVAGGVVARRPDLRVGVVAVHAHRVAVLVGVDLAIAGQVAPGAVVVDAVVAAEVVVAELGRGERVRGGGVATLGVARVRRQLGLDVVAIGDRRAVGGVHRGAALVGQVRAVHVGVAVGVAGGGERAHREQVHPAPVTEGGVDDPDHVVAGVGDRVQIHRALAVRDPGRRDAERVGQIADVDPVLGDGARGDPGIAGPLALDGHPQLIHLDHAVGLLDADRGGAVVGGAAITAEEEQRREGVDGPLRGRSHGCGLPPERIVRAILVNARTCGQSL